MTPDSIRSAIASNPQSSDTRAYLIKQAVENDMADEIPDDWTMDLYDPDSVYDDTLDLIADEYRFESRLYQTHSDQRNLVIDAHESGSVSIRILPNSKPIIKFGVESADTLINMLQNAQNNAAYVSEFSDTPEQEIEPITGISITAVQNEEQSTLYDRTVYDSTINIPTIDGQTYSYALKNTLDVWLEGLTSMANSAETYKQETQ